MIHRNAELNRAMALLLLFVGGGASAAAAPAERDVSDSKRDLVGFNQILHLVPRPPTMYPTGSRPTPYPVSLWADNFPVLQGSPPVYPDSPPVHQAGPPVYPDSPKQPPRQYPPFPAAPKAPTRFPTSPPTPFPTQPLQTPQPTSMPTKSIKPSMSSSPPSDGPSLAPFSAPTGSPSAAEPSTAEPEPSESEPTTESPSTEPSEEPTESEEPSFISDESSDEPSEEPTEEPTLVFVLDGRTDTSAVDGEKSPEEPKDAEESKDVEAPNSIADIICDVDNAEKWGTMCVALKETDHLQMLGGLDGRQYTLFAPTNNAFDIGDHALEELFDDNGSLTTLVSIHIASVALSYSALVCDLGTEMSNFDMTITICIGGIKFQTAEGNEIHNIPVISDTETVEATNGFIHSVSNLILPVEFSIKPDDVTEHSVESDLLAATEDLFNKVDGADSNGNVTLIDGVESEDSEDSEESVDDIEDDIEDDSESVLADTIVILDDQSGVEDIEQSDDGTKNDPESIDVESEDVEESDIDTNNDSESAPVEESEVDMKDNESFSDRFVLPDAPSLDFEYDFGCTVCEDQELCAIPRAAVMQFPGEGLIPCINVITRQNQGQLQMLPTFCTDLQDQFKKSCLIGGGGN